MKTCKTVLCFLLFLLLLNYIVADTIMWEFGNSRDTTLNYSCALVPCFAFSAGEVKLYKKEGNHEQRNERTCYQRGYL